MSFTREWISKATLLKVDFLSSPHKLFFLRQGLPKSSRLVLGLQATCLNLSCAGIIGMHYHAQSPHKLLNEFYFFIFNCENNKLLIKYLNSTEL
jgi:hypothetical protein